MKKNIIILNHPKGCRLANQLWNYASILAYAIEKGYDCKNYSFIEDKRFPGGLHLTGNYYNYFEISESGLIKFFLSIHFLINALNKKINLLYRYVALIKKICPDQIIYSGENLPYYLPPTSASDEKLNNLEKNDKNIYFDGWYFRNPAGLLKYHKKITGCLKPKKQTAIKINDAIAGLKNKYDHIVGVHIRQADYQIINQGKLFLSPTEVYGILLTYLQKFNKNRNKTIFIICSDGEIDKSIFSNLNILHEKRSAVEDLFLLAKTDVIIGSNSTFGAFAAYLGLKPFIVLEKNMDWDFYRDKTNYFENKKCTMVHF